MKKRTIIVTVIVVLLLTLLVGGTVFATLYESDVADNAQTELNELPTPDYSNEKKDASAETAKTYNIPVLRT